MLRFISVIALLALAPAPADIPFSEGERLQYAALVRGRELGDAELSVSAGGAVRGIQTWRFDASGEVSTLGVKSNWKGTSWAGRERLLSRRFHRSSRLAGISSDEQFEILPDSQRYRRAGESQAWVAPAQPMDEIALLYHLRTLDLAPGQRVTLNGYFRNGWNPVRVAATGRESVPLASGRSVICIRLHVSAAGTSADIWLTDDARRVPARIRVPTKLGQVELRLR
jgi:hypothetical protein